ncbi:hypothetical protein TrRE_jg13060, partial [Triparma retinervis]
MQSSPSTYPTSSSAVRAVLSEAGARGLMKGVLPPLLSISLYQAVCFASFQTSLRYFSGGAREEDATNMQLFKAGTASGFATVLVTTPTDLLKIRLQLRE